MNPFFEMQLHMLRAACVTMVTAIDLILKSAEPVAPEVPPAPEPEKEKVFNPDPFKCEHPRTHWRHAPSMGHPNRFICQCGEPMEEEQS